MNPGLALLKGMRPHQWTKNAVVAAAGFFAAGEKGLSFIQEHLLHMAGAMGAFCLASSSIYLLNDIKDRELDRLHPVKRFRPIASGDLPVPLAAMGCALLILGALAGGWTINPAFAATLGGYWLLQTAYCFGLKQIAYLDVMIIAAGFLLRVLAGAHAVAVPISHWLLICTFLLATYLGLAKRRHEKVVLASLKDTARPSLRGVDERTLDQALTFVSGATLMAYVLYTIAPDTVAKFDGRHLALTIPLVAAGLWRYHRLIYKHDQGGRPEKTLFTDPAMIAIACGYGLLTCALFWLR